MGFPTEVLGVPFWPFVISCLVYGIIVFEPIVGDTPISGLFALIAGYITIKCYVLFIEAPLLVQIMIGFVILALVLLGLYYLLSPFLFSTPRRSSTYVSSRSSQPAPVAESQNYYAYSYKEPPSRPLFKRWYHGCPDKSGALDIYENNRFLIDSPSPSGVYLSDDLDVAAGYARNTGYIVEFYSDYDFQLEKKNQGHYYAPVSENISKDNYYRIKGINPIRILDCNGEQVKP